MKGIINRMFCFTGIFSTFACLIYGLCISFSDITTAISFVGLGLAMIPFLDLVLVDNKEIEQKMDNLYGKLNKLSEKLDAIEKLLMGNEQGYNNGK